VVLVPTERQESEAPLAGSGEGGLEGFMRIPFDLGFVFHPEASDEDNAEVLRVLLECLIACDMLYRKGVGRRAPSLYNSGVVYGRTDVWDATPDLQMRRYGDCKSLTADRCAELRLAGESARPVFRFAQNPQSGKRDFHILVHRPKGFEDPSRRLGMEQYHRQHNLWLPPQFQNVA
jgi:hypothetical protein